MEATLNHSSSGGMKCGVHWQRYSMVMIKRKRYWRETGAGFRSKARASTAMIFKLVPKDREIQPVVFGKSLLAAQVWREMPELHNELIKRLPGPFVQTMTQFGTVLKMVEQEATDANLKVRCPIMSLEAIDSEDQPQFRGVRCWQSDVLKNERKFSDMTVLIFRFSSDIRSIIRVPFFDGLYAEIAKDAPTASIVFGWKWLAIISPKTNIKDDLHKWCWKVLRKGFEANQPIKGEIP